MQLHKAYIGLHLTHESENKVNKRIDSQKVSDLIERQRLLHLTLHFFGDITTSKLNDFASSTKSNMLVGSVRNSVQISLGKPEHFISYVDGSNIFYLPAINNYGLFSWLKSEGYSINTPHVTIFKGQNMTESQIQETLIQIRNIIPPNGLFINIKDVFYHGKDSNQNHIEKIFSI